MAAGDFFGFGPVVSNDPLPGYVPADVASPSESFLGGFVADDVHSGDIYPMLQAGLRRIDEEEGTGILQRALLRAEELWRRHQQKLWRITRLSRIDEVPDVFVPLLLTIVAFGEGSGLPWEVAQKLSVANQRKLLHLAVPYWLKRGRRVALEASIRFVTGLRPAIDSWFDVRSIVDELILGGEGGPTDPWLLWSTRVARDAAPNGAGENDDWAEHHVSLRVPGLVGDAERQQMVLDLCDIARPFGERYEVAFVDFIDVMLDGWLSWWESVGVTKPVWSVGTTSTDPVNIPWKLPGLFLATNSGVHLNYKDSATWGSLYFSCFLKISAGSFPQLRFGIVDTLNYWTVSPPVGVGDLELHQVVAGVSFLKATAALTMDPTTWAFGIDVLHVGADVDVKVYIDGVLKLSHTEAATTIVGSVGVRNFAAAAVEFQRPEVFQHPLTSVLLTP